VKTRSSGSLRARILFLRIAILVGVLGIWQAAGSETIRLSLPTFTRVLTAIGDMLSDGSLIEGLLITNQAMVAGFALALLIGLPLGIAMGSRASVERLAQPYLTILLAMPMIAVTPIVQGVFGLSFTARVVIVFLFSFIYVVVNAAVGVQGVAAELREMGRSFGASRADAAADRPPGRAAGDHGRRPAGPGSRDDRHGRRGAVAHRCRHREPDP
jgi:ABC-type nitrate/sulfonate/bicarbonate transport system permease component